MRRADGDHMPHPGIGRGGIGLGRQPGPRGQAAHAVGHHQWWPAGAPLQVGHRALDRRHPVVDVAEGRLQRQRGAGHAQRAQARQPGPPHAAVAEVAMHQQHAGAAGRGGHVRLGIGEQRLVAAEHPPGGRHLASPGPQQIDRRCPGRRRVAAEAGQQQEFQRQHRCGGQHCHQQPDGHPAGMHPRRQRPGQPGQRRQHRGGEQQQLQTGQHGAESRTCWRGGLRHGLAPPRAARYARR